MRMAEFQENHSIEGVGRAATWLLAWEAPELVGTGLAPLGEAAAVCTSAGHLNPGDKAQELLKC